MRQDKSAFPHPVVLRLPKYLAYVRALREQSVGRVSSQALSEALGLTSSTVRQDFSHLELAGTPAGYDTAVLERALRNALGAERVWSLLIVGAGNLGRALAMHGGFERHGFAIRAIFDSAPRVIGQKVGNLTVKPMSELQNFVQTDGVDVGIITVPAESAQKVADALARAGVKGILNLTLANIRAPGNVAIVDTRIVSSLWELTCRVTSMRGSGNCAARRSFPGVKKITKVT